MKKFLVILSLCVGLAPLPALADKSNVSAADKKHVQAALQKLSKVAGKELTASDIKTTPIPGLLQVTSDYSIFYVSTDGKYLVSGDLIDLSKDKKSWSLTELAMRIVRKQALAQLDAKSLIIYPAKGKKIGTATVFTDVDCAYCRKLQDHIDDYNDLGIEIRYVAFPRSGPDSPSFKKAVSVWCAKDRQKVYTDAVEGKDVPDNQCKNNSVARDFELGRKLGVTGTPTIFLDNGMHLPGLVKPEDLAEIIKNE